eukprot:m.229667 g.229667  ORF g.229667 m.229667 type:complete len:478 (-) comp17799_c0_seq1:3-1436(-)
MLKRIVKHRDLAHGPRTCLARHLHAAVRRDAQAKVKAGAEVDGAAVRVNVAPTLQKREVSRGAGHVTSVLGPDSIQHTRGDGVRRERRCVDDAVADERQLVPGIGGAGQTFGVDWQRVGVLEESLQLGGNSNGILFQNRDRPSKCSGIGIRVARGHRGKAEHRALVDGWEDALLDAVLVQSSLVTALVAAAVQHAKEVHHRAHPRVVRELVNDGLENALGRIRVFLAQVHAQLEELLLVANLQAPVEVCVPLFFLSQFQELAAVLHFILGLLLIELDSLLVLIKRFLLLPDQHQRVGKRESQHRVLPGNLDRLLPVCDAAFDFVGIHQHECDVGVHRLLCFCSSRDKLQHVLISLQRLVVVAELLINASEIKVGKRVDGIQFDSLLVCLLSLFELPQFHEGLTLFAELFVLRKVGVIVHFTTRRLAGSTRASRPRILCKKEENTQGHHCHAYSRGDGLRGQTFLLLCQLHRRRHRTK